MDARTTRNEAIELRDQAIVKIAKALAEADLATERSGAQGLRGLYFTVYVWGGVALVESNWDSARQSRFPARATGERFNVAGIVKRCAAIDAGGRADKARRQAARSACEAFWGPIHAELVESGFVTEQMGTLTSRRSFKVLPAGASSAVCFVAVNADGTVDVEVPSSVHDVSLPATATAADVAELAGLAAAYSGAVADLRARVAARGSK